MGSIKLESIISVSINTLIIFHADLSITLGYLFNMSEYFGFSIDLNQLHFNTQGLVNIDGKFVEIRPLACEIACYGSHCWSMLTVLRKGSMVYQT